MPDLVCWLPALLWLLGASLHVREARVYHRARRDCNAMQDRAIAALERCRALLREDPHA